MAFVDEIQLYLKAGKGGDGVERWLHEKYKEFMGPCGGNGGRGGDMYLEAVRDITILENYKGEKEFRAENGEPGGYRSREGKNGEDFILKVPVGTVATNLSTDQKYSLDTEGEKVCILRGGKGGFGNEYFKSSRNTTPRETTPGKKGEQADFLIEVQLIADVGFIGFPSAGKSSLLNSLTNAQSKIGAYDFTTLEPHLGTLHGYVLADLPGLIEGASKGKGLGYKFLRHVRKTRMLVHLISVEREDVLESYHVIRKELEGFDEDLIKKDEIILLSKIDEVSEKVVQEKIAQLEKTGKVVKTISVLDDQKIKEFSDFLIKTLHS